MSIGTGSVAAPVYLEDFDEKTPRKHVPREAAFQRVVNDFLGRVLVPPFFKTGIQHENELTDNARARARKRGVLSGVPDVYVAQHGGRSAWLELKWGKNPASDNQEAVHAALHKCGIAAEVCRSIHDVLKMLRIELFDLHPNAANLATEYQARAEAAVAKEEAKATRTRTTSRVGKPRAKKATAGQIKAAHRAGVWRFG